MGTYVSSSNEENVNDTNGYVQCLLIWGEVGANVPYMWAKQQGHAL